MNFTAEHDDKLSHVISSANKALDVILCSSSLTRRLCTTLRCMLAPVYVSSTPPGDAKDSCSDGYRILQERCMDSSVALSLISVPKVSSKDFMVSRTHARSLGARGEWEGSFRCSHTTISFQVGCESLAHLQVPITTSTLKRSPRQAPPSEVAARCVATKDRG